MNEVTFILDENQEGSSAEVRWVAAVSQMYELFISPNQTRPCLLDTTVDPNELGNFFK